MEYLSIDRIENGIAVCENDARKRLEIPLSQIDGSPKEGDIVFLEQERYRISFEETKRRRKAAEKLQRLLFEE